jgi:DNA-binding MarR family transcriptional regulator
VHQLKNSGGKTSDLSEQMLIIKDFIDEFYNKTVFHGEKALNSDLTPSQIKSLFAFEKDDHEYPIGELGKNARVKSSTMTDMIDRLQKDGIAERIRDDGDRRVVKVRLTDKGKKIKRQFSVKMRQGVEEAFAHLSEDEKKILIDHLKGAYQILKRIE